MNIRKQEAGSYFGDCHPPVRNSCKAEDISDSSYMNTVQEMGIKILLDLYKSCVIGRSIGTIETMKGLVVKLCS